MEYTIKYTHKGWKPVEPTKKDLSETIKEQQDEIKKLAKYSEELSKKLWDAEVKLSKMENRNTHWKKALQALSEVL